MPHQALARQWRPKTFEALVGQINTRQALANALDHQRLHHAYLFTGTRGVGKTTIARILAKCLNCENGIDSKPCLQCSNCQAIDAGEFSDLIEVDAASRTKVDDTRDLLDNAQYAPSRGRFKIYLIDEVHMLSTHSFNALLKTLEEPPEHVKFLLATTDPQKLPVTILSRCLQFNLKLLTDEQITPHLSHILDQERVDYEPEGLRLLARAAQGSLRDALSLLDQAIAFCEQAITAEQVRAMIGSTDPDIINALLSGLIEEDLAGLLEKIQHLAGNGADFHNVLNQLADSLHRIALLKHLPENCPAPFDIPEQEQALSNVLSPECIQLYYQIIVQGQRDLPYAPSARSGFEMIVLRLIAFQPKAGPAPPSSSDDKACTGKTNAPKSTLSQRRSDNPSEPVSAHTSSPVTKATHDTNVDQASEPTSSNAHALSAETWYETINQLGLSGLALQAAKHCEWAGIKDNAIHLSISEAYAPLASERQRQIIEQALNQNLGQAYRLTIQTSANTQDSPMDFEREQRQKKQAKAESALNNDPQFKQLINTFDGQTQSISPKESS